MTQFSSMILRLVPWFKLSAEYTAAYVLGKILAAAGALILVRALPVSEYGTYTILLAAYTFIVTFSDLGATETLAYFRRRAANTKKAWKPYLHVVLRFRRIVFGLGSLLAIVYVGIIWRKMDTSTTSIVGGTMLMIAGAWFAVQFGIFVYVLKLEKRFRQAYAVEVSNEGTKLLLITLIWAIGLTTAWAGILSIAAGAVMAARLARTLLSKGGDTTVSRPICRRQMIQGYRVLLAQVLPILLGTIHFTLQGPFIIWLAAYYGSTQNVAEIGALSRLNMIISVIAGFTNTVFVPKLAEASNNVQFSTRYFLWWLVIILAGTLIILAVYAFPETILLILGNVYSGLTIELVISASIAIVGTWNAYAWSISRVRGWSQHQHLRVPIVLTGQTILFFVLDFSTTRGVLLFGLGTMVTDTLFQMSINLNGVYYKK